MSLLLVLLGWVSVNLGDSVPQLPQKSTRNANQRFEQHVKAARAARADGLLVKAAHEIYAAAKLRPEATEVALEGVELFTEIGGHARAHELARMAERQLDEQRARLQSARDALEQMLGARVREGIRLLHGGMPDRALQEFANAIGMDPVRGELYIFRARALALTGQSQEAVSALQDAARRGFRDQTQFIEFPAFQAIAGQPAYRSLLQDVFGEAAVRRAEQFFSARGSANRLPPQHPSTSDPTAEDRPATPERR